MPLMDMRTALSSAPGGFETEQRPGMTAGGPSGEDPSANAALAPFYTDVVPTLLACTFARIGLAPSIPCRLRGLIASLDESDSRRCTLCAWHVCCVGAARGQT